MKAVRTLAAVLVGFLTFVFITLGWVVMLIASAWSVADCSGMGWAISCRTNVGSVAAVTVWGVFLAAVGAWFIYRAIRGLGRWVSDVDDSRTPTNVATMSVVIFVAVAVAVLFMYVVGDPGNF